MIKWTARLIKRKRKEQKLNSTDMGALLGMSRPTYERLEKGDRIDKYIHRLEKYYNSDYSPEQEKILRELKLFHLLEAKEHERTTFKNIKGNEPDQDTNSR